MIEVCRDNRVRVQFDASEVDYPGEAGRVVDDDLLCRAAGWKGKRDGAHPLGRVGRGALLVKDLAVGSVNEALENDRPVANACQRARRYREVVADDIDLRELRGLREIGLGGMRDANFAPVD